MTKDMTEGRPFLLILKFAIPLLLGNLFQQFYNMVDSAIVGQTLGAEALGSVGASSSVQFLILGFCIGCCCGFAIPIAQAFGAKDFPGMRNIIFHAAILTAGLAVVLTIACAALTPAILHLLKTPEPLYQNAYAYLVIIFLGIPCSLLYNMCSGILRSVGDSRTPFFFLAFSACLNIGLDFFCILVLHWGVAGAAIATVASQGVSGILCLIVILTRFDILRIQPGERAWSSRRALEILGMGMPMGLQYSITAIGSMMIQGSNNALGALYTSSFAAAQKIKQLAMCPFDAFATATATYAGQNFGARRFGRIREGVRAGVTMGVSYGLLAGVILLVFRRQLPMIFVPAGETAVLDAAARYLRWQGYFFWWLGILNVVRMTIQGIGYSGRAVYAGVLEMIARSMVAVFLVPRFGFGAVCISDQTAWIPAALYCVVMYLICMREAEGKKGRLFHPYRKKAAA